MNESKHTPGPWQCQSHTEQRTGKRVVMAAGLNPIAVVHNGDIYAQADAELIAAAPDLLASVYASRAIAWHQKGCRECQLYRRCETNDMLTEEEARLRGIALRRIEQMKHTNSKCHYPMTCRDANCSHMDSYEEE